MIPLSPEAQRSLERIERAMKRAFKLAGHGQRNSQEAQDALNKAARRIAMRAERLGWLSAVKEERHEKI